MVSIVKKELKVFFGNATAYVVIGVFLLLTSLFLWLIPGEYNVLDSGYANVNGLFYLAPWLFLFLCPSVTMRLFSEEKQIGTWELLKTRPIGASSIVVGKFLAAFLLVCIALLPSILYFLSVWCLAEPVGNVDSGGFWGSYIGLFFLAAVYCSVGVFASSFSKNQSVCFITSLLCCFFLYYGFDVLGFFLPQSAEAFVESFGINSHYKSISRGVLDSRDIAYFLFLIFLFLTLTINRVRK